MDIHGRRQEMTSAAMDSGHCAVSLVANVPSERRLPANATWEPAGCVHKDSTLRKAGTLEARSQDLKASWPCAQAAMVRNGATERIQADMSGPSHVRLEAGFSRITAPPWAVTNDKSSRARE